MFVMTNDHAKTRHNSIYMSPTMNIVCFSTFLRLIVVKDRNNEWPFLPCENGLFWMVQWPSQEPSWGPRPKVIVTIETCFLQNCKDWTWIFTKSFRFSPKVFDFRQTNTQKNKQNFANSVWLWVLWIGKSEQNY